MQKRITYYSAEKSSRENELSGLPLAPFIRRAFALLVDFLIAGIVFLLFVYLIGSFLLKYEYISPQKDVLFKFTFFNNWYSIIWLVIYFTSSVFLSNGSTLGKWIFGIRILSLQHERISLWHSFERALGYSASALEAGFGFFQYFLRKDRRTVHDRIAETIVILKN